MDSKEFQELLISKSACSIAKEWANGKSWQEVYETCHRGDWLLWLFAKTNPDDLQLLTLAKGHCANTVRHLMVYERSVKAVDTAIAFGMGKATLEELKVIADIAIHNAHGNYGHDCAADAAYCAANHDYFDANAASSAASSAAYAILFDNPNVALANKNRQVTADICRQYLPIHLWNISKKEGGGND